MHKGTNKNNYSLGFIETQCKLDCQTAVFCFISHAVGGEEGGGALHGDTKNAVWQTKCKDETTSDVQCLIYLNYIRNATEIN